MSAERSRRAQFVGIAVVAVVVVLVVAFVATRSPSIGRAPTDGPSPPSSPVSVTTLPEPAVAVGQPEASTVPPAPSSSAVGATSLPGVGPALSGAGAILVAPPVPRSRPAPTQGCSDLGDPGWTVTSCGTAGEARLLLTWLVETESAGSSVGHRVSVWRPATAGQYDAVLVAADDQGTLWSDVGTAIAPVSVSGGQQLLVGFRVLATGALDLDLVDAPGRVVVHRAEALGAAVVSPGEFDAWAASPARGDPACCPSAYVHEVVRNTDGVWRLVLATRAPGKAPPSQV